MSAADQPWPRSAEDPSPTTFRVDVKARDGHCIVLPHGELDVATVAELRAVLTAQRGRVVLDLRDLRFIDVAGLRLLLEVDAAARRDGMSLSLVVGDPPPLVFGMAGVGERFAYAEPPDA
jgi:anti-anti-sigma factor